MLSNDERASSDHSTVGDRCFTPIEIQPPHADRFRLEFAPDPRFDDEIIVDALAGREPVPHRHRTVRHARRRAVKPDPSQSEGGAR